MWLGRLSVRESQSRSASAGQGSRHGRSCTNCCLRTARWRSLGRDLSDSAGLHGVRFLVDTAECSLCTRTLDWQTASFAPGTGRLQTKECCAAPCEFLNIGTHHQKTPQARISCVALLSSTLCHVRYRNYSLMVAILAEEFLHLVFVYVGLYLLAQIWISACIMLDATYWQCRLGYVTAQCSGCVCDCVVSVLSLHLTVMRLLSMRTFVCGLHFK